jgi:hypothetical protein
MEKLLTTDEDILKYYGWEIECESPFEVRNIDGSFATGQAASCVLNSVREEYILEKYDELMEEFRELSTKNKILNNFNNDNK